jgi:hypothetical protein
MQPRCNKCRNGSQVAYLVGYQLLVLDDTDYVAETGRARRGWWGLCCVECLRRVQETPELIWLEAIPLSDVVTTSKESDWHEYHPNWSRATVRVGSRVPSRAVQALIAACGPAQPTPRLPDRQRDAQGMVHQSGDQGRTGA